MRFRLTRRSVLAGANLGLFGAARAEPLRRPIRVTGGQIVGVRGTVAKVAAWLGVPYAAPPVGPRRWRLPQPVIPWAGVRKADSFSASPWAMPQAYEAEDAGRHPSMDEDCLTLNVWAPDEPSAQARPVVVWIYGGAFVAGASSEPLYDGANMAAQGVVFVSINYRVGILGFFAHPELARESADGVSGNYGLLDQVAALQWVRDNIAAFGGDPDNITIAGQSAGSFSVAFHLVMPRSQGLFHRGVAESGAAMGQLNSLVLLTDGKAMEAEGVAFAKRVCAPDLAALRAMPPMDLVRADHDTWVFHPAVDGVVIPEHPFELIKSGRHADVPLIAGFNADEGAIFPPLGDGTPAGLAAALEPYFGDLTDEARRVYPARTEAEAVARGKEVFGDLIFNWNTTVLAVAMAEQRRQPVYFYHFAYRGVPLPGRRAGGGAPAPQLAYHGAEIGLALRNPQAWGRPIDASQRYMTEMLSGYWLSFARSGDPNGAFRPAWPVFDPRRPTVLHIDGTTSAPGPIPFRNRLSLIGRAWRNLILEPYL